jgi:hypothetical protein
MVASRNAPTDSRRLKRDRSTELFTRISFGRSDFDARAGYSLLTKRLLSKMNPPLVRPSGDNLAVVCMLTLCVACSLAHN